MQYTILKCRTLKQKTFQSSQWQKMHFHAPKCSCPCQRNIKPSTYTIMHLDVGILVVVVVWEVGLPGLYYQEHGQGERQLVDQVREAKTCFKGKHRLVNFILHDVIIQIIMILLSMMMILITSYSDDDDTTEYDDDIDKCNYSDDDDTTEYDDDIDNCNYSDDDDDTAEYEVETPAFIDVAAIGIYSN